MVGYNNSAFKVTSVGAASLKQAGRDSRKGYHVGGLHFAGVALVADELALPGGGGHSAVGDAEGVEQLRVRERGDGGLDAVGGVPGGEDEVLSGLSVAGFEVRRRRFVLLVVQPLSVMSDERGKLGLCLGVVGERAERFDSQLHVGDWGRGNLLDIGGREPGGLHDAASAARLVLGGGGNPVADGVVKNVAELEIGNLLVPFFGSRARERAAQIRAGCEGLRRDELKAGLEGKGAIAAFLVGWAMVDEENGDGASACRQTDGSVTGGRHGADGYTQGEAAAVGHGKWVRLASGCGQSDGRGLLPRVPAVAAKRLGFLRMVRPGR